VGIRNCGGSAWPVFLLADAVLDERDPGHAIVDAAWTTPMIPYDPEQCTPGWAALLGDVFDQVNMRGGEA
jgi:hypothetical protein